MGIPICSGDKHWHSAPHVEYQIPPFHLTVACTLPLYLEVWGGLWGFFFFLQFWKNCSKVVGEINFQPTFHSTKLQSFLAKAGSSVWSLAKTIFMLFTEQQSLCKHLNLEKTQLW